MKITFSSFIVLLFVAGMFSCKKDNFNYPKDTVAGSKIIYFPTIAIKEDKFVAITQGAGYADSGAVAILNGAPVTYTTSMTIDANTAPGVYRINYTAANAEGYTASDARVVVVVPTAVASDPVIAANDFSGTYLRALTGVTSTWTKIANGVYTVENPGGSSGVGLRVIVTNYSGTSIDMPSQDSPDFGGTVSSTDATYSTTPPATYSWVFNASGYGTSTRTFVKQ